MVLHVIQQTHKFLKAVIPLKLAWHITRRTVVQTVCFHIHKISYNVYKFIFFGVMIFIDHSYNEEKIRFKFISNVGSNIAGH